MLAGLLFKEVFDEILLYVLTLLVILAGKHDGNTQHQTQRLIDLSDAGFAVLFQSSFGLYMVNSSGILFDAVSVDSLFGSLHAAGWTRHMAAGRRA